MDPIKDSPWMDQHRKRYYHRAQMYLKDAVKVESPCVTNASFAYEVLTRSLITCDVSLFI